MKSFKSLLLGTAACVISTTAYAADPAAPAPVAIAVPPAVKPIDYVKVCGEQGAGFYQIPGSDICLKVGGGVRAQVYLHSGNIGADVFDGDPSDVGSSTTLNDTFVMGARGLVSFDARSKTDYGTLRGYIEVAGDGGTQVGNGAPITLRYAYIQLGNESGGGVITAGTADSFFAPEGALGGYSGAVGDTGFGRLPLIGYTYKFSDMVSASLALEDHDVIDGGSGQNSANSSDNCQDPQPVTDNANCTSGSSVYVSPARRAINGSTGIPDVVANVTGTFDWGSLFAGGALSYNRVVTTDRTFATPSSPWFSDSNLGWAINGGGTLNVDAITKGDKIQAKVSYADGATGYIAGPINEVGILDTVYPDVAILPTSAYGIEASALHNWSATWNSVAHVGYVGYMRSPNADTAALVDGKIENAWNVGANLQWQPIKKMTVGTEIFYASATSVAGAGTDTVDGFGSIFRFERGF